ncbi:UDP-glucose 4-epimerase [Lysobacter niabensis]|uniref:UDP-glucose 4-epimerase n=1 Tax=Agrilutibacter niabensis TaxID=380628 RepID=A0ABU1VJW2_9GAMM|nr:NAD-dependent epimerase/dehydratase family protein [Lysobacter niabensis]MDR7097747.1 UDP-glucose 4-epimerase [Lysobacter niabensis]
MTGPVVVLGAGGFIGRHLAEAVAASGIPVIAATRRAERFLHPGITNVTAAFDREADFLPLLAHSSAVIHAASISTPGSSAAQPQLEGNLRTTLALIEALQASPGKRLVYLSSGGTLYGDRERSAHEDDPLRPRSYHGAGKAAAEHFVHAWAMQFNGTAVLLRPSNVYGPGQLPRRGFGIIPTAFDCTRSGTSLTIWGDGSAIRDYLYVDDLTTLCQAVLAHALLPGAHTFNASWGKGITLDGLLDAIDATTMHPLKRDYQRPREVDVRQIVPDSAAARDTFDWRPAVALEQGLQRTWLWFTSLP